MKKGYAYCVGGPLDDQRVEIDAGLYFKVVFMRGEKDEPPVYHYAYDTPRGVTDDALVEDWTKNNWIARYVP